LSVLCGLATGARDAVSVVLQSRADSTSVSGKISADSSIRKCPSIAVEAVCANFRIILVFHT